MGIEDGDDHDDDDDDDDGVCLCYLHQCSYGDIVSFYGVIIILSPFKGSLYIGHMGMKLDIFGTSLRMYI